MGCCPDEKPLPKSLRPGIRLWYNQGRKLGPHAWAVRITTKQGSEATISVESWTSLAACQSMYDLNASPAAVVYFPNAVYTRDEKNPGVIVIYSPGSPA